MAAVVQPPVPIPGPFYVLSYDKEGESFTLYIDDQNQSSYVLGALEPTLRYLSLFGGPNADLAIDCAKQFGTVQVIPAQRRVLPLFQRSPKVDVFAKVETHASMPALR